MLVLWIHSLTFLINKAGGFKSLFYIVLALRLHEISTKQLSHGFRMYTKIFGKAFGMLA